MSVQNARISQQSPNLLNLIEATNTESLPVLGPSTGDEGAFRIVLGPCVGDEGPGPMQNLA